VKKSSVGLSLQEETNQFLASYQDELSDLYIKSALAGWKAANTGNQSDFEAKAKAELELKTFHSNKDRFTKIQELLKASASLDPLTVRSLQIAELEHKENQLPNELIKQMVDLSTKIEQTFNTFRGEIDGKKFSNNELLTQIEEENNSVRRKQIWEALKQVGEAVAPNLIELAKIRNKAAKQLGYKNFWDMRIRLQEHDPVKLVALFKELEKSTNKPFSQMKQTLDKELAKRFKVKISEIQAWHYDNPFFQAAPPSDKIDLDEFYKDKKKEDIVQIAKRYYSDLGFDVDNIINRSDLYEREGKDQHAFSTDIDRAGDVRTLQNVRPKAESMDTMLHEFGHALYAEHTDRSLPFNIRDSAHIFTTEAVAMFFGAMPSNADWMVAYLGIDPKTAKQAKDPLAEQRKREQLIFARWTLVMLNFEKALYENPTQNLNKLWWKLVERYQKVRQPKGRNASDWASKPHFTIAPVYYHNYMMGELFAAQIRATLAKQSIDKKAWGEFFKTKIFFPGMRKQWPEFVKEATGQTLSAKHFAKELK